ncbi:MAG: MFS transporter [Clostridia bacterium]|nr:MFS transporter [Clostridia bacterium]
MEEHRKENKVKENGFYKWIVVALCFFTVFTTLGFCSSTNQLFVKPVSEYLEISRSLYSLITTIRYITVTIINLFFASLIMKFGPKKLILAGTICLSLAMVIFAIADSIWMFYLGGIFLGLGFAWTGSSVMGYVVNMWFKENRGTIMGIVLCANGLGGAFAMQVISAFIESNIYNPGYKVAYLFIAGILALLFLLVLFMFKNKPQGLDKLSAPAKKKARGQGWSGIEFSKVKRKPYFYIAMVCMFLTGISLTAVNSVSAAHMRDVGLDAGYVATVLSLHSIALAGFKFLVGYIYDKFGLRITSGICTIVSIIVMVCLAIVTNSFEGKVLAMVYGIFSSLALPLETVMLSIYANDLFGEKSFSNAIGIITSTTTAGIATGSYFTNLSFDLLGSYKLSLLICAGIMAIVFVMLQFVINSVKKERKRVEYLEMQEEITNN